MKQTYLHPPKRKNFGGKTFLLFSAEGMNREEVVNTAKKLKKSFTTNTYRVHGFKAPSWVYTEGKVFWIYKRPKDWKQQ